MKDIRKQRRQKRTRGKIQGDVLRPRLSVFRSNKHIYAQLIDDSKKVTLLGVSDAVASNTKSAKIDAAKKLGVELAKRALEKKIKRVVFDKGSYAYHGRVKAVADGAREGGLEF